MKNKSFIGIDISKNVIDVSIFCEGTPIKDFPHDVFNNSRKGFGEMCTWLKKNHVVLSNSLFGMEFTGSYSMELEKFLNARKYQFCMLSTHVIKHYPMGPKDKSDKIDSAQLRKTLICIMWIRTVRRFALISFTEPLWDAMREHWHG